MSNSSVLNLFQTLDSTKGRYIFGGLNDQFGFSVSGIGDINGDGISDFAIGARYASSGTKDSAGYIQDDKFGKTYVIFGGTDKGLGSGNSIDLNSLNGTNGFVIVGTQGQERVGQSVSGAGDVNGDGIDDLIVGSYAKNIFEFTNPSTNQKDTLLSDGRAYVIFGKKGEFSPTLNLNEITTDKEYQTGLKETQNADYTKGFSIRSFFGNEQQGLVGFSVSSAGDIDKDGFDDLIVGAPGPNDTWGKNSTLPGEAWIVFGFNPNANYLKTETPADRERQFYKNLRVTYIDGITEKNRTGNSVSQAGDINGDGTPDLIIGARDANGNSGESYVVFGGKHIIPGYTQDSYASDSVKKSFDLKDLNGKNGFKIVGSSDSRSGWAVSGAGDVNGDGYDDLIIGVPYIKASPTNQDNPTNPNYSGNSYVVFGGKDGFPAVVDPSQFTSSLKGKGFVINGKNGGDGLGFSVSSAGDFNGDGIDDLLVGAPFADAESLFGDAGATYVIYGSKNIGANSSLDVSSLNGNNGFVINGTSSEDNLGWSVSSTGDVNKDGFDDLIVGAPELGKAYLIFGKATSASNLTISQASTDISTASIDVVSTSGFEGNLISVVNFLG
ncbi:hypothetical protein WA1_14495 [Scytonema hofmannii PCC 7110]|uniref:Integrin n=1 Tax=Scytonema hofmannii PCC 7110 TaxID=128403 RepID=A0A139XF37_9CYAN|nr:integrin alpha [Scytonema hofmannii]KYC43296.1 hypothetical protein WA1_14495 [Scytonema hofmannii PCC 7110]